MQLAESLVDLVPHIRADDARCVRVDGDLVRRELHGQGLGQTADGPLAGRVDAQGGKGLEADDGRRADDLVHANTRRRLRVALGDHLLGRERVAVEDALEVDVEDLVDIGLGDVEQGLDLRDARVGHHERQRAQLLDRLLDHGLDLAGLGDVCDDADGAGRSAAAVDLVDDAADVVGESGDVVDADGVAVLGEAKGDCFSSTMRQSSVWPSFSPLSSRHVRRGYVLTFLVQTPSQ